jgi:hypothetical protein
MSNICSHVPVEGDIAYSLTNMLSSCLSDPERSCSRVVHACTESYILFLAYL